MTQYGNLPLGQALKLVVSIIGEDAVLAEAEEQHISIIENIEKDMERTFKEENISLARLRPSREDGILEIVRRFFGLLETKYGVPKTVQILTIPAFFGVFRDAIRNFTSYELKTKDVCLHLLNWFLGSLEIPMQDCESNTIYTVSKAWVLQILSDSHETIFNEIFQKLKISKTDFFEELQKIYKRKPLADFEQALKRDVSKCCKNNSNEPWRKDWKKFEAVLDFVHSKGERELVHRLIGLYLLQNAEKGLEEICGITKKDLYQVKQDIRLWAQDKLPAEPQSESQYFLMTAGKYNISDLSLLQKDFIEPDFQEQLAAISGCGKYLWGNSGITHERAEQLIDAVKEKCPHCGAFFANWARARLAVLSCLFDNSEEDKEFQKQALDGYRQAFDKGRNFAGAYIKPFIEESIAAAVYFERRRIQDIPKVIDTDKNLKVPVTDNAKRYYEYGYALNLFEQESAETYFLHFHAVENFLKVFPAGLFIHKKSASKVCNDEMLKAKGVYVKEYDPDKPDELKKMIETEMHTKELLRVTEKTINRRMEIQRGHNIQYTPQSAALLTRRLDIAEHYLNDFKDSLDVTVINTHGSTALMEALTQYKRLRFSGNNDETALSNIKRYKAVILEIIKRSPVDSLYAETVKKHISVLEESINAFDIEIVKAILEKKGFDIQNLTISADEFSPLYYAVMRMKYISDAIKNGRIEPNGNITWKNLDVPGMFKEDKQAYYGNMVSDPLFKEFMNQSCFLSIGVPSIWDDEIRALKEIVHYLTEKTNDVDAFVKQNCNVLSLAVESDFSDICRLLIEKGADPSRVFCINKEPFDTALFRAVYYKSCIVLKMLLTDYRDRIGSVTNERFGDNKQTPAHLLFRAGTDHIYPYEVNQDNFRFIETFIPLFRAAGADFNIPDIGGKTVRQILRDYGIENI